MAFSRLSGQDAYAAGSSATYPGATTAGNLLLCSAQATAQSTISTPTGWTQIAQLRNATTTVIVALFAKTAAGTETTVTATNATHVAIFEFTGAANPFAQDGTAATTSTASSVSSFATPAITTTQASSLVFVVVGLNGGAATGSGSWVSATALQPPSSEQLFSGQYLPGTTLSGFTDTASWTNAHAANTLIAGFKAAAVTTVPERTLMGVGT